MLTYRSGNFIFVEIVTIGILLKWDRGTRVYLKLDNRWKGKVQGLCGNYNYDGLDDFTNPSKGVESSPTIFGHSWRLDDSCASKLVPECYQQVKSIYFLFFQSQPIKLIPAL